MQTAPTGVRRTCQAVMRIAGRATNRAVPTNNAQTTPASASQVCLMWHGSWETGALLLMGERGRCLAAFHQTDFPREPGSSGGGGQHPQLPFGDAGTDFQEEATPSHPFALLPTSDPPLLTSMPLCRHAADLFGDCDGDPNNGCEVDLLTRVDHCGGCNAACALDRATAGCVAGACTVAACETGKECQWGHAAGFGIFRMSGGSRCPYGPVPLAYCPEHTGRQPNMVPFIMQATATVMDSPARAVRRTCVPLPLIVAPATSRAPMASSASAESALHWHVTQVRAAPTWPAGALFAFATLPAGALMTDTGSLSLLNRLR